MDDNFVEFMKDESSDLGITSQIKHFIPRPHTVKLQNAKNKGKR